MYASFRPSITTKDAEMCSKMNSALPNLACRFIGLIACMGFLLVMIAL